MHWILGWGLIFLLTILHGFIHWQSSQGCGHPCLFTSSYHTFPFQSTFGEYAWIYFSVNSQPFKQWPSMAYPHCGGLSWCPLGNSQVSSLPFICASVFSTRLKDSWYSWSINADLNSKYYSNILQNMLSLTWCGHLNLTKQSEILSVTKASISIITLCPCTVERLVIAWRVCKKGFSWLI